MGLFSSTKTNQTTQQHNYTTNSSLQAQGPAVQGEGNTLQILDAGAVSQSLGLAYNTTKNAIDAALAVTTSAAKTAADAISANQTAHDKAAATTLGLIERYQSASNDVLNKTIAQINTQSNEARDFALSAVTSETGRITDKFVNYGGAGILALVALFIIKA